MLEHSADLISLLAFTGVVSLIAGVGIVALPWKDDELAETTDAIRQGWAMLDRGMQQLTQLALRAAPSSHEPHTVAFEPPTSQRAA